MSNQTAAAQAEGPETPLPAPPRDRISAFLTAVRRRAIRESVLKATALTAAALLLAVLALALLAVRLGPATFWPSVTALVLLLLTVAGVGLGWVVPARRLRSSRAVATLVGRRHPAVASDLLSAVELDVPANVDIPHGGSRAMAIAFRGAVADGVAALDPGRLVPFTHARRAGIALAAVAALFAAVIALAPKTMRRGLDLLMRFPTRFEGARVSREPLIGDVRLTYQYPAYTGLPPRTVEGSTGDIVGIKGTRVSIDTKLLHSARAALLLFGEKGEAGELPAAVNGGKLAASLTLRDSGSYRVWLSPLIGRPVRELRAHRIVVEADRPPEVDIVGAADRLELPTLRPVEVGYAARDDFGLGKVELVYRVDDGPEHRLALKDGRGARKAQDRIIFEPATAAVGSGSRIAYRIEARDRDDVSGAKVGSSRTLYIVVQNARENLDEQLGREKEVLDKLLQTLADRLELGDDAPKPATPIPQSATELLAVWRNVHEAEESHLALLGRIVDDERRAGTASKALVSALAGIADRLGKQMRGEATVLAGLKAKADDGTLGLSALARLGAAGVKHIAELETSVLLLDDLIGRQRLEDLAALGRELTDAFKRLQDLMARYDATKDEALRRQIEHEIRALRARIEELGRKIAEVKARNEVPTEWQNMPDLKDALSKVAKLDELLQKGDPQSLSDALSQLGESLQSLQEMLDKNANDFGGERFSQESRAMNELMKKLGDLEGDQKSLARDSQSLAGEVDAELGKKLEAQMQEFLEKAKEKAEALRKELDSSSPRELGETGREELQRAREAARQLRRMIPAKDFVEAQKEAERAVQSLKRVRRSLDAAAPRKTPSPSFEPFAQDMGDASKLADELASDLEKLVPRPENMMSPGQRERSRGMAERQTSLEQRTQELADEMARKAGQIPGTGKGEEDLRGIGQQMGQAGEDLGRGAAKEGSGKAQDAADRLSKLRESMNKGGRQMGRSQQRQEPVRIPGADESKAPHEWRQELLEAMRERPPERFREEVRRYYEELVK